MDFWQFFIRADNLDIDNLKEFFKSYGLDTKLIDLSYEKGKEYFSNFTFFSNEKFAFEVLDFTDAHNFFDEFDSNKNENGYGVDGIEFEEKLKEYNIPSNERIYKLYFTLSPGGNIENSNIYLSDNDIALYTYVYALYLSEYHKGILYYSNDCVYVTNTILNKLIKKGLEGKLINGGINIINKKYVNYTTEVIFEQKYFLKRKINYKDVIKLANFGFGVRDEFNLLVENKIGKHTLIFDRNQFGRGIDLYLVGKTIVLSLSIPTSSCEIRKFYELVNKICDILGVDSYIRNNNRVYLADKEILIKEDEQLSMESLKDLEDAILQGELGCSTITGVYNPLSIGVREIGQIKGSIKDFGNYLNNIQSIPVFYPRPKLYKNDITGNVDCCFFVIGANIPTVFKINDLDNIKIGEYYIVINDMRIKRKDFITYVKEKKYYDAEHVLITLNENEMVDLVEMYSVDK